MITLTEVKDKILQTKLSSLFIRSDKDHFYPSEVAALLNSLPVKPAVESFLALTEASQLILFNFLGTLLQKNIIGAMTPDKSGPLLNKLNSTDLYSFYSSLDGLHRSALLCLLNTEKRKATEDMLGYPSQSVARLVNTSFCTISQDMTIEQATAHLRENHVDSDAADVVYVTDEAGKLLDDIPIRRLVLNDASKRIAAIMDCKFIFLNINDTTETAIARFRSYDRNVLPVVNDDNLLLGIVTIDDLLDVAEQRTTQEMQRFGGTESLEYPYVKTSVYSLIRKRAGWLIILFLSEMLTATAMGFFEKEIAKAVVLALFVPLVISSGGNSGSQAATLIIRALAVGEITVKSWFYVMKRELLSGLSLGVILGSIGFLRITAWQKLGWYNYGPHWLLMSTTIFFSLIGIVMWGTLSGSMIPIVLKRLKQDPATSSAPFVATLVDVTGLVIYFSIAAILLKGTIL